MGLQSTFTPGNDNSHRFGIAPVLNCGNGLTNSSGPEVESDILCTRKALASLHHDRESLGTRPQWILGSGRLRMRRLIMDSPAVPSLSTVQTRRLRLNFIPWRPGICSFLGPLPGPPLRTARRICRLLGFSRGLGLPRRFEYDQSVHSVGGTRLLVKVGGERQREERRVQYDTIGPGLTSTA